MGHCQCGELRNRDGFAIPFPIRTVLGGFGGCARDIAETLGLASPSPARPLVSQRTWAGLDEFGGFGPKSLNNGLSLDENRRLAETSHVDEAITLVLRGLRRVIARAAQP